MKQLLFVHGGDSLKPGEDFFVHWNADTAWKVTDPFAQTPKKKKWKDDVAEKLGPEWACAFPRFPNDMDAHYAQWKWWLEQHFPFVHEGVVLVGHSLGGNFLAKYLSENDFPVRVAQLHLIAPAFGEGDFTLGEDLSRVPTQVQRIFLYHSSDDRVVPLAHSERFHAAWPTAVFTRFLDRGHFTAQESFPELLEHIRRR